MAIGISITALVADTVRIVADPSYTTTIVLGFFNNLLMEIAGGILVSDGSGERITPPLPDLFYVGSAVALVTANNVVMPTNYQRGLVGVYNASGSTVKIHDTWDTFIKINPLMNTVGPITRCAIKGRSLYYQGMAAETLPLHYHRTPNAIDLTDTTVDGLPDYLVRPLLVFGSCARIFQEIEDGTEGNKTNTKYYNDLFMTQGIKMLERSIPVDGAAFSIN